MSSHRREHPTRVQVARAALSYIARRGLKTINKPTLWQWVVATLFDAGGLALLSWAGFQIHSALGYSLAGIGCFVMAQKFRPSKEGS